MWIFRYHTNKWERVRVSDHTLFDVDRSCLMTTESGEDFYGYLEDLYTEEEHRAMRGKLLANDINI